MATLRPQEAPSTCATGRPSPRDAFQMEASLDHSTPGCCSVVVAIPDDVLAGAGDDGGLDRCKVPLLRSHGRGVDVGDDDGASFGRTCLNSINAISGIAVLSMPYALALGGWLSIGIFLVVGIICYYTGILIQRCMDANPGKIRTYPDIGEHAFGRAGRTAISVFMYFELYLVAVSFLILEGDNLDKLFPGWSLEVASVGVRLQGKQLFIVMSGLIILPTTWFRNLAALAYISASGLLASLLLLASLIWVGFTETGFHRRGKLLDLNRLPTALGLFFVCFTCHAVFPTIHSSMRKSALFSKVLVVSFTLCTLNYALTAILGYLMYGEDTASQVTLNLSTERLSSRIAIYSTLLNPFAKFALAMAPIAMAVEEAVPFGKSCRSGGILLRTLLLASTVVVALAVPFFASLMAFVGSFLSVMVSVMFPCLCYLKIYISTSSSSSPSSGSGELVAIAGILLFGFLVAVTGTYSSLKDIVHSL